MFGFNPTGDIDFINSSVIGLTLHDPNNQGEKISILKSATPIDLILKKNITTDEDISFQYVNISNLTSTNNGYLALGVNVAMINSTISVDLMPEQDSTLSTFGLLILVKNALAQQSPAITASLIYDLWTVRCPNRK